MTRVATQVDDRVRPASLKEVNRLMSWWRGGMIERLGGPKVITRFELIFYGGKPAAYIEWGVGGASTLVISEEGDD